MRKITTPEQNNKCSNWTDDHGEVRWDGKHNERKSFITTL